MKAATIVLLLGCTATPSAAQIDPLVAAPPNLVLSNYNGVPVGPELVKEGS